MLQNFIVVSFAAFMGWQVIRYLTPQEIPERLAPFIVLFTSLLFAVPFGHWIILGFASAGGVGALNLITKAEGIPPLNFFRKKEVIQQSERRKIYVPDL